MLARGIKYTKLGLVLYGISIYVYCAYCENKMPFKL